MCDGSEKNDFDNDVVGLLTLKERRFKILKFIRKKSKFSMSNKFSYECRKQVAEKRLRIKGRFVTRTAAFGMLGLDSLDTTTNVVL